MTDDGDGPVHDVEDASAQLKPRTRRTVLFVAVAAVVVAGLCVAGIAIFAGGGPVEGSFTATNTSADASTHAGDLRGFLLAPPASSHPMAMPIAPTGTVTLEDDVASSIDKKQRRALLQRFHYVIGAVAEWKQADGTIVLLRLLRFSDPNDARGYFDEQRGVYSQDYASSTISPIPDVPGAATYVINAPVPGGGYTAEASFGVKGDVVVAIFLSHPGGSNLQIPQGLMQQQYAKL